MIRRRGALWALALVFVLAVAPVAPALRATADTLPDRLTDAEFWQLTERLSEPNGYFRSDNLLSNELRYPEVLADLVKRVPAGRVYLGVGPEQNFNYIVALKPKMVFITDVRRGNLHTQLMYKALFELSADRSEFVSRLFSKPRQPAATEKTSATALMEIYCCVDTAAQAVYEKNLADIKTHLTKAHALPLSAEDLDGIEYVYYNFYWFGPGITYNSSASTGGGRGGGSMATYRDLMSAEDGTGIGRSYLASEETFKVMKDLEQRNLIVPVVGNFGGPKTLKAVGEYVRDHGAIVGAFYLSNVEQYLRQDGIWTNFCGSVATMPLDDQSTFIRSQSGAGGFGGGSFLNMLGAMQAETRQCQ